MNYVLIFNNVIEKFLLFDHDVENKLENNLLIFLFFFKFIKRIEITCDKVEER
jgi:hypothetical protein